MADRRRHASQRVCQFATTLFLAASHVFAIAHAGQTESPRAFDETAVAWQSDQKLFAEGLHRAKAFRSELLAANGAGRSRAKLIAEALVLFQERSAELLDGRPDLTNFQITTDELLAQLRARTRLDGREAFGPFDGRWYGMWQKLAVDHHWHPVVTRGAWIGGGDESAKVESYQYAWVGDGFGWNYVCAPAGAQRGSVILGMVYHLVPHRPKKSAIACPTWATLPGAGV